MNTQDSQNTVQVKRLIKARPERIFAAWTNPEQIVRWFGPGNAKVKSADVDLREGGSYAFTFHDTGMGEMTVAGKYREVQHPSRLVFTWQWQEDEDWKNVESVVTVEIAPAPEGTELTLTHTGIPSGVSMSRHEHGWQGSMDKLSIAFDIISEHFGPGHFSWNELLTTDVEAAGAFYKKLLGWESTIVPGAKGPYTLFRKNKSEVAGMMAHPMAGAPPHWLAYITVQSVDESVQKIWDLGGTILVPAFDIPEIGRLAVAQDPQGASFGIWERTC